MLRNLELALHNTEPFTVRIYVLSNELFHWKLVCPTLFNQCFPLTWSYFHYNLWALLFWHFYENCFLSWGLLGGKFSWNVQVQIYVWAIATEFLLGLPIVAERDFVIIKGLWQNMKGPKSSFLSNQECIQHKFRKIQLGSEAEVSGNVKGSSRKALPETPN